MVLSPLETIQFQKMVEAVSQVSSEFLDVINCWYEYQQGKDTHGKESLSDKTMLLIYMRKGLSLTPVHCHVGAVLNRC